MPDASWRNVLWLNKTKTELFGHNDRRDVWRSKGEAFRPKTLAAVKSSGVSSVLWSCGTGTK